MKMPKNKEKDLLYMAKIFEVEYDNFKFLPPELTNISAFPSVVSIQNGVKVDEFSDQRTPEKLKEFIKSNASSGSVSTPRKKKPLKKYLKKN